MKKNIIQITEQDLHNLIKESVQKIIKESLNNSNNLYSLIKEDFNNILRDYGTIDYADGGMEGLNFIKRMDYIRYALSKGYDVTFAINYNNSEPLSIKMSHDSYTIKVYTNLGKFMANNPREAVDRIVNMIKKQTPMKSKNNNYNRFKI